MGSIAEDLGEISTRLVKRLVTSAFPEETTRHVVYLPLVSNVGGSPVASIALKKFCLREFPHFGNSCTLTAKKSPLLRRPSFVDAKPT